MMMNSSSSKGFRQLLSLAQRQFSLYSFSDRANNPRIFLTLSKNGQPLGDLVFELYKNHVPNAAENVLSFATGSNEWKATYAGTLLDKGLPGFVLQGGRASECNASANGGRLTDEGLHYMRHTKRGQLTLVNDGENANGHEFMITLGKADQLDGYNVLVGELIEGESVLDEAEDCLSRHGYTTDVLKIENCGTR
jgi:peptidylprolyl isomerase